VARCSRCMPPSVCGSLSVSGPDRFDASSCQDLRAVSLPAPTISGRQGSSLTCPLGTSANHFNRIALNPIRPSRHIGRLTRVIAMTASSTWRSGDGGLIGVTDRPDERSSDGRHRGERRDCSTSHGCLLLCDRLLPVSRVAGGVEWVRVDDDGPPAVGSKALVTRRVGPRRLSGAEGDH
jgi:hypothetical protein